MGTLLETLKNKNLNSPKKYLIEYMIEMIEWYYQKSYFMEFFGMAAYKNVFEMDNRLLK